MINRIFKFSVFVILIFTACVREEIISNEALSIYEEKPVVYCFLTEGDSISVWIAHTLIVYDKLVQPKDTYVFDAKVFIKNEENEKIELFLNDSIFPIYSCSQQNFKIKRGKKYLLEVFLNNLSLTAETKVPEIKDVFDTILKGDTIFIQNYNTVEYYISTTIKWSNDSKLENILFVEDSIYCKDCSPPEKYLNFEYVNFWYNRVNENNNSLPYEIVYNEYFDYLNDYKYFHLYTLNSDITSFTSSYELFENVNDNISGNHFLELFRGVIPEYSNIEGGYGVFGAYLSDTDSIRVKP